MSDKLGTVPVHIGEDENLRHLEIFHRDRPKGPRGVPTWNLSMVLHQLTQAPFESLEEVSLNLQSSFSPRLSVTEAQE